MVIATTGICSSSLPAVILNIRGHLVHNMRTLGHNRLQNTQGFEGCAPEGVRPAYRT